MPDPIYDAPDKQTFDTGNVFKSSLIGFKLLPKRLINKDPGNTGK